MGPGAGAAARKGVAIYFPFLPSPARVVAHLELQRQR